MAGAFTHLCTCFKILSSASMMRNIPSPFKKILRTNQEFVYLGSVSPDIPYLGLAKPWADAFHYEKTNEIVSRIHSELGSTWNKRTANDEALFAWLCGYVAHLVGDATIHPVVEAIVGPYDQNKDAHRVCEMIQDVCVYRRVVGSELGYSEFSQEFQVAAKHGYHAYIMGRWKSTAKAVYPELNDPDPAHWAVMYRTAIDTVEGGSPIVAIFRHAKYIGEYIYQRENEIATADKKTFFSNVKLPNGETGDFMVHGFDYAVRNILQVWSTMSETKTKPSLLHSIVRNWNLDTGRDQDLPGKPQTYWQGEIT